MIGKPEDRTAPRPIWAVLIAAALSLFVLIALTGCDRSESDSAWESERRPANPLLYEIANADGEVEGWLLGTIHALPDGVSWRTSAIDSIIATADELWVEIADQDEAAANAATFARLATTPDLPPLSQRVSPALREPLDRILARSDIPRDRFLSTEDWAAAIMLARVDAKGDPANGVDRAVIAGFSGRPVRGFETTASQLAIFDTLPARDQQDLLEATVQEWIASRDDPDWLLNAWLSGDEARMVQATNEGILADPELHETLLAGRNRRWLAMLLPRLNEGSRPLVAVGTAHLVGPEGLVALLEAEGFTVTRV